MNRRDKDILDKMLLYCVEIDDAHEYFNDNHTLFLNEKAGTIYRNAVSMSILQIGELTKSLSAEFREQHKGIPWRDIMRMRDLFAHHYGAMNAEQTWHISHSDIAELKQFLQTIIEESN